MGAIQAYESSCYCKNIQRISADITRFYNSALAPFGVSVNQFSLLFHLRKLGPCNRTELAQFAGLERTTIVRNVSALAARGLVEERPGPTKRNALLVLSAQGERVLDECHPAWRAAQEKVAQVLGPGSLEHVKKLGKDIAGLLEQQA